MTAESLELAGADGSLTRRRMVGMCSLGLLGVAGLAACGSDDESTAASTGEAPPPASITPSAPAGQTALVKVADVPVGGAVSVESAGKPVIVSMPAAGAPVAFQAVCPHKFVTVVVKDGELYCPAHASTFDIATGENLVGPAAGKPLPEIPVSVVGDDVVTA